MKTLKLHATLLLTLGISVLVACTQTNEWKHPVVSQIDNPAGIGARYPNLASNQSKLTILASWLYPNDTLATLLWSRFDSDGWSVPQEIASGDNFFVNWADFPSIATWDGNPLAAHWLARVAGGTYSYHINMSMHDIDDGWGDVIVPHQDQSATEHGFVSLLPLDSTRVFALWLDGQNMSAMSHGHMQAKPESEHGKSDLSTAMTLRSVILHADGSKSVELEVDASVCECCQTSITRSGDNLIAVYRNRDEYETREIFKAVYSLVDNTWSEPVKVSSDGWIISGCPVNGPQIDSFGKTVIAAWFNAANNEPKTYAAVSLDGGSSFAEPILLDSENTGGRVDVTFNATGQALLTWVKTGESSSVMGSVWNDGRFSEPFIVGDIQGSRASGFPRSAGIGERFMVIWTDPSDQFSLFSVMISPN